MSNTIRIKFLLFALMPMSSLFGVVGNLDLFHQSDVVSMYFQPESIKGRGIKSVIVVLDFENVQTSQDGKEIRSIRMVQNYDCAGKRIRLENAINYANNMLRGNEVSRGSQITSWQRIPKGAPYEKLLKKVCGK
ncbi:hypothetical protein N9U60_00445 [Betaproteobacteria bacterium]|nr:hypothetical protein [Betaproteobacteria bacterium]